MPGDYSVSVVADGGAIGTRSVRVIGDRVIEAQVEKLREECTGRVDTFSLDIEANPDPLDTLYRLDAVAPSVLPVSHNWTLARPGGEKSAVLT